MLHLRDAGLLLVSEQINLIDAMLRPAGGVQKPTYVLSARGHYTAGSGRQPSLER